MKNILCGCEVKLLGFDPYEELKGRYLLKYEITSFGCDIDHEKEIFYANKMLMEELDKNGETDEKKRAET